MRGIILAAGRGDRLDSVYPGEPKCLITFGGKSLIMHQVTSLVQSGISEIVVVVGYKKELIENHLKDISCKITFIKNPIYSTTNTLYSLWLAREFFDDDFIYFNADVLFDYRIVKLLNSIANLSNLACVPGGCGEEEVKVTVENSRIIEIGKHISPKKCYGEFVGIAKFVKNDNVRFAEILEECVKDKKTWNFYFEYAVNLLLKESFFNAVDISGFPATEIDFPEDLSYARQKIFPLLVNQDKSGHEENYGQIGYNCKRD